MPAELIAAEASGVIPRGGTALDGTALGGILLDLGCGTGQEAVWLAARGYRVVGVDGSREALALARRRAEEAGVKVEWRHASVLDLPLDDGTVAFALDRGCFHAIAPEDRDDYASEVTRVLASGAHLLLRGAAEEDDEAGLWAVDAASLARYFPGKSFTHGPLEPMTLAAGAGDLLGHSVLLTRTDARTKIPRVPP